MKCENCSYSSWERIICSTDREDQILYEPHCKLKNCIKGDENMFDYSELITLNEIIDREITKTENLISMSSNEEFKKIAGIELAEMKSIKSKIREVS